ncbi:Probable pectate lyase 22 [Linum perenne]
MASLPFLVILPLLALLFSPHLVSSSVQDPELVVEDFHSACRAMNESRRKLSYLSCATGNPIDDCWRCDPNWSQNRQRLADCAIGFQELVMNSFKTIDGRGASIHVAGGPCITIHYATNIIIHGINIHDCKQGGNANIRNSPRHYGWWTASDGDGISVFASKNIWIDHCTMSNCRDGLIDVIHGSTAVTISNNHFTHHDKVMLLGHKDSYTQDKNMQVTIAFNHFGEGLVQRMPRCRNGYFHVVNNDYTHWEMYAIGGSASPTINSEGNRFLAPYDRSKKEVTKHEDAPESEWKNWNWRSEGDLLLNGAFFRQSGAGAASSSHSGTYARASSLSARPASFVASMTTTAGALSCRKGSHC